MQGVQGIVSMAYVFWVVELNCGWTNAWRMGILISLALLAFWGEYQVHPY
jgi:hypothetical protein